MRRLALATRLLERSQRREAAPKSLDRYGVSAPTGGSTVASPRALRLCAPEAHLDAQPPCGLRVDGELGPMGGCDRVADRQAETTTAVVAGAVGSEPLEWAHERDELLGRDDGSAVG